MEALKWIGYFVATILVLFVATGLLALLGAIVATVAALAFIIGLTMLVAAFFKSL